MKNKYYILIGVGIGIFLSILRLWFVNPSFVFSVLGVPFLEKQCFLELADENLCNHAVKEAKNNRWGNVLSSDDKYWSRNSRLLRCIDITRNPELCLEVVDKILKQ